MLKQDDQLVIASHNQGKIHEIKLLLEPFNLNVISAADLGVPEPEETGTTFIENSVLKAVEVMKHCNLPCLADDSGLAVDDLNGDPGVYSARWAQKQDGTRDFRIAYDRIFQILDPHQPHKAHFVCVLTLAFPDGRIHSFEGQIHGHVSLPARGEYGFGYDPIFTPEGYSQTFAEMEKDFKQGISHRHYAFEKLKQFLRQA